MSVTAFLTDSTLCIGCKACEVACKEWNGVAEDGLNWSGYSYDNTGALVGLGIGLFALGAIAAASSHDRYYDRYDYGPPPPPPPPAYGYRYDYGY